MNMKTYQDEAMKTAIYPDKGNNIFYPTLGLVGEAGEIANKVKKIMRDLDGKITPEFRDDILGEIGDVMWYITTLCYELDATMDEVAFYNLEKLKSRQQRGVLKGAGGNR